MDNSLVAGLFFSAIIIFTGFVSIQMEIDHDTKPLVVYIAGKYWNATDQGRLDNTNKALDAGIQVIYKCNYPIVPHLFYYADKRMEVKLENSAWYTIDNVALVKADIVLKISNSTGAFLEEKLAKSLGIPVYYNVSDIPNRCKV